MKKILLILAMLMFIGCGDDVTNINGYTDEQVQAKIDSTLANMESETVTINDTIYQMTVDTVYKMVIDTVKEQMYDTLYKQVVDTVTNELADTIYQRVIDTVYNELIDTIYQRVIDTVYQQVIDTVFKELEFERPRDTTVILPKVLWNGEYKENVITNGKVHLNKFYDIEHVYSISPSTKNSLGSLCSDFAISNAMTETDVEKLGKFITEIIQDEVIAISFTTSNKMQITTPFGFETKTQYIWRTYSVKNSYSSYTYCSGYECSNTDKAPKYICAYDLN